MACFTISAAAGIVVAVSRHIVRHHEKKLELANRIPEPNKFGSDVKRSTKLAYLELSLLSGSFILALEHVVHGEIVPYPPFLTALKSAESTQDMLKELLTVGVPMLVVLVIAWAIGVVVVDFIKFKSRKTKKAIKTEVLK